ncbi:hypothetical protein PPERSA_07774 [Pseudocohnilembus persalinus]|uniref:Uncharacterized protein n=1 Tax=Pseudocohnilembus persalinus TaxID=266149 RepID=A0A0V0R9T5_PSEPJ|nr:hypothetical protein PPERSA_07774 [Pseudocohnilembus persalinus]|eukprot:KRX11249.1 hypothetical protein PPERSA_07774 [Pseudocohnilembus persalinus]
MNVNLSQKEQLIDQNNGQQNSDENNQSTFSEKNTKNNYQNALTMPVRDQLQKLEDIMQQVQKDLENSRQDMNFLHTKLGGMRNDYLDEFLFLSNNLLNEKNRLTQELRKGAETEQNEMVFLDQQMGQLAVDKEKLDQVTNSLDLRVVSMEDEVGFKHVYD